MHFYPAAFYSILYTAVIVSSALQKYFLAVGRRWPPRIPLSRSLDWNSNPKMFIVWVLCGWGLNIDCSSGMHVETKFESAGSIEIESVDLRSRLSIIRCLRMPRVRFSLACYENVAAIVKSRRHNHLLSLLSGSLWLEDFVGILMLRACRFRHIWHILTTHTSMNVELFRTISGFAK